MYTLILGGNGYIAKFLRKALSKEGIPTIIFCRKTPQTIYKNEHLVLGDINDHDSEINSILYDYGLAVGFPDKIEKAANNINKTIEIINNFC